MEALKERTFKVIERQIEIKEFENWLYSETCLAERMDDDLILELYSFNYNQRGVDYEFRKLFLSFFNKKEFTDWKIIANLEMLRKGSDESERILWSFNDLTEEGYSFLSHLGYSVYDLEESEYLGWDRQKLLEIIREESAQLLEELNDWIRVSQSSDLKDFKSKFAKSHIALPVQIGLSDPKIDTPNKWWEFWK